MAQKRDIIIMRNEQNEVSPPHRRIAGGVRFDGAVERSTHVRETKLASRKTDTRGLNVAKQFEKAARSRKRMMLDV